MITRFIRRSKTKQIKTEGSRWQIHSSKKNEIPHRWDLHGRRERLTYLHAWLWMVVVAKHVCKRRPRSPLMRSHRRRQNNLPHAAPSEPCENNPCCSLRWIGTRWTREQGKSPDPACKLRDLKKPVFARCCTWIVFSFLFFGLWRGSSQVSEGGQLVTGTWAAIP
jgi:hypothetical protein